MKPFLSGNFVIFLSPKWQVKETMALSVFAQRAKIYFEVIAGFTFSVYIYGINISKVPLPVASDMRYRIECVNDISRAHTCACKWRAVVRDMESPNPSLQRHTLAGTHRDIINSHIPIFCCRFVRSMWSTMRNSDSNHTLAYEFTRVGKYFRKNGYFPSGISWERIMRINLSFYAIGATEKWFSLGLYEKNLYLSMIW